MILSQLKLGNILYNEDLFVFIFFYFKKALLTTSFWFQILVVLLGLCLWWTSSFIRPVFAQSILQEKEKAHCVICRDSVLFFLLPPFSFHCQTFNLFSLFIYLFIWLWNLHFPVQSTKQMFFSGYQLQKVKTNCWRENVTILNVAKIAEVFLFSLCNDKSILF